MLSCVAGGFSSGHKGMDGCGAEQEPVFGCGEVASRGTVHLLQLQLLGSLFRLSTLQTENKCGLIHVYLY